MKITFNINYHTVWGESLYVCGDIPELGQGDGEKAVEMQLVSPDTWQLTLNLSYYPNDFNYWFIVKAKDQAWRFEWGEPHRFVAGAGINTYSIFDSWHELPQNKPFFSSAFTKGIFRRPDRDLPLKATPGTANIRIFAPMIRPDQVLAISGEGDALGNWDPAKAIRLSDAHFPLWEVNLPLGSLKIPFEYKFLVLNKATGEALGWEAMNNRLFGITPDSFDEQIVIDGTSFANPLPAWKGAGTAIPVFSIRTEDDFGIGDFCDIKKIVDWCALTNQNVLQILPVNDTTLLGTWVDSYPYRANSIFALHPMYLRLEEVGMPEESRMEYYESQRRELNALETVDYERVNKLKHEWLREVFTRDFESLAKSEEYQDFHSRNFYWLKPYAAWSLLRDLYQTPDNKAWGEYAEYDDEKVDALINEHRNSFNYYCFLQYHLDRQLRAARDYAHTKGVVLKGDIPIGISRWSVDAWTSPELFNMDTAAGAPPDDFSVLGQNWGLPTYNWDKMAEDGFQWWKNRFRKMSEYFDLYRIDHILGFFRIWQIPLDAVHGLLGYFNPAMPFSADELRNSFDFWINPDVQTQPLILDWMLNDFFSEWKDEVRERFLDHIGGDRYCLKPFINTQQKVEEYFLSQPADEKNERLKNAFLGIIDDVLFIEDPYQKGHYHPRIAAQYTYQFRVLTDYEKWCFNRLYTDFFYHRHNDFWYGKAMWKLPPLLDATSMLACGEDLGMIPDCVPAVMDKLKILSLEIQRMPKDPKSEFGNTWGYPYYSVCTTSTHDMDGIRAWWEADPQRSQRYFNNVLHEGGQAPYFAEPWICERIVNLQLQSPSMLCVLPLQDWLSTNGDIRRQNPNDELINVPANPRHYWRYRMHLTVEKLLSENTFNTAISNYIKDSNR